MICNALDMKFSEVNLGYIPELNKQAAAPTRASVGGRPSSVLGQDAPQGARESGKRHVAQRKGSTASAQRVDSGGPEGSAPREHYV